MKATIFLKIEEEQMLSAELTEREFRRLILYSIANNTSLVGMIVLAVRQITNSEAETMRTDILEPPEIRKEDEDAAKMLGKFTRS